MWLNGWLAAGWEKIGDGTKRKRGQELISSRKLLYCNACIRAVSVDSKLKFFLARAVQAFYSSYIKGKKKKSGGHEAGFEKEQRCQIYHIYRVILNL